MFNSGYLFLQCLYYDLGLHKICNKITEKYKFEYNFNEILANLIYSRIIYPASKRKTHELCKNFIMPPTFDLHHIYRSLSVIAENSDFIQAELYKNSKKYAKRNDKILYYDCTNYFFEINQEDNLRKYGMSKEHRPNPIVQMGLFLDADGIPLAFNINSGNTNEQITLQPLEEKIIKDFEHSRFVVCTDAGLASTANRKFNNTNNRAFITTQPIKKLKSYLEKYAIDMTSGWKLHGSNQEYDLSKLRTDDELIEKYKNSTFYKERWINDDGLEQRLIVTYSVKYQEYQKKIRECQIERMRKALEKNPNKLYKAKSTDPKRLVRKTSITQYGEVAEKTHYCLDDDVIFAEMKYDGIYAVCTNLNDDVEQILKVNKKRWEIEESFRIMKSELEARPVYLSREDRIKAHFTTCFLALVLYRYLEKALDEKYTANQIIETLRNMNLHQEKEGYIPSYERTDLTDKLHEIFDFRTDYEINTYQEMKKIYKRTQKQK